MSASDSTPTPTPGGTEVPVAGPEDGANPTAPHVGEPAQPPATAAAPPPVVSVQNVSITYRTTFEAAPTLKNTIVRLGRGERKVKVVDAVKNMSFDIKPGTSVGIIGANGAGKSTLMRAIAGVLPPSQGRIEVRGRISALLALGVGFNPNLTGRENVILGGLAAGLTRAEVKERADEVADFAEIGDFMDMPMRTYSSGMYQRLAFSVSVHMDPDILLVDEALSAGDASFKVKATAKMAELMESARAMFLVSHSLGSIREMCNEVLWIHKGELIMQGSPRRAIRAYTNFLKVGENAYTFEDL
ncbi:ABC transporter ATP-binding protein [Occultella glacieicola]|uniref:ABC transporter ATP-binding protein n=1 Tax=Occultella glacieicola TaxID=2518684 RepID=A0ABY2E8S3_9MICO|nr:ABC transporter ATP-binding protein [Occultella glacieicola]